MYKLLVWIRTLDVLRYPWTESFYCVHIICVAEMYVCINTVFISFYRSSRDGKRMACARAPRPRFSSSLLRGWIKRNPRRYKFIIVRAEPFFPPEYARGAFFCDFYPLMYTAREGTRPSQRNCHCCYLFNDSVRPALNSTYIWNYVNNHLLNVQNLFVDKILCDSFIVTAKDDLRYDIRPLRKTLSRSIGL